MNPGMGIRAPARAAIFLLGLSVTTTLAQPAAAYTPTVTATGKQVKWQNGFKFNLAGNPANLNGIKSDEFFDSVVNGLQRWKAASSGAVNFDYWQGSDPSIYEPNSNYNGLSSIYFASNTKGGNTVLSPNVLGLTQVWFNTDTGQILEADIVLNDKNFEFTLDPTDTSGPGAGHTSFGSGKNKVFIENVISHELGHAFGLSHSGSMQSTMLFMESPEQAYLGCDEHVGIHAIYPSGDAGQRGSIVGDVFSPSGQPVFGAHVLAISRDRGTLLATGLTNRNGRFQIQALEPGSYFLEVEPFYAGAQVLPSYFSRMSENTCPSGQLYSRRFLTDGSGYRLAPLEVTPGSTVNAGQISVTCNPGGGAAIAGDGSSSHVDSAPTIYGGSGGGFGAVDRFQYTSATYYKLNALSGSVDVHGISHTLYSPVRVSLALLDSSGQLVRSRTYDQVYEGHSGYVNFDTRLVASGLSPGSYFLRVTSSSLNPVYYPGGQIPMDPTPFVVITGSVNEGRASLADSLPENARCFTEENFANYTSPPGLPPRSSTDDDSTVGFCSSIRNIDSGSSGPTNGPSAPAIIGWLLPYALMLAYARYRRLLLSCASALPRLF